MLIQMFSYLHIISHNKSKKQNMRNKQLLFIQHPLFSRQDKYLVSKHAACSMDYMENILHLSK
jgi:hypothetical protein